MAYLSRRTFLQVAGAATLATAAGCASRSRAAPAPSAAAPFAPAPFGKPDVELRLTAQVTDWELAPNKVIQAWTYNGKLPGETIRVREGERVRVIFQNELPEPTTVHWHGVDVPFAMDGVPDLSQPTVQPDQTFVYEFVARPAGTRWYHTHFNSAQQMDLGLSAPLIIEPATAETGIDRDFTLVLDDWVIDPNGAPANRGNRGGGMMGGMMGSMMGQGMMDDMMGDEGPPYDTFTINGKAHPATEPLKVKQGERVRLRLINASNMQTFVLRLLGHALQVTHTDGNPLQTPVAVDAVPIAPSERYDVTFMADQPGRWPLYALDEAHSAGGLQTLVVYEGHEAAPVAALPGAGSPLRLWSYKAGQGMDVLPPAEGRRRSYELTLSGGMMMAGGSNVWTINGQTFPDTDVLTARLNQPVLVRLFNMSMHAHPFHLHGQSFRVLSVNGVTLPRPLIKDSVDVPAMMGTVEIEFVALNPGDWMFHCHKPIHMDGGMATLVKIA